VTLRDKVRSCEIRKAVNIEPVVRIEIFYLRWFGQVSRMSQEISARQVLLAKPMGNWPRKSTKDQTACLHLQPCLVLS